VAHCSLSVAAIFSLDEQSSIMSDIYLFKRCPWKCESRPHRTRAVVVDGDSVRFPVVGPENLVRLAEDSLRVYSTLLRLEPSYGDVEADRECISSISGLTSRDATSPTRLSSAEAAVLAEMFHQVLFPFWIFLSLRPLVDRLRDWTHAAPRVCSYHLWFRLYTHALLLESRIFPDMELDDESPDYIPFGFVDTWKEIIMAGRYISRQFR
jgi:hypothetical protein